MRKLLSFWLLCARYIFVLPSVFLLGLGYIAVGLFSLLYGFELVNMFNDFTKKIGEYIEEKVNCIIKDEKRILNKDIIERVMNGEYGLTPRPLNWLSEIIITVIFIGFIFVLLFLAKIYL